MLKALLFQFSMFYLLNSAMISHFEEVPQVYKDLLPSGVGDLLGNFTSAEKFTINELGAFLSTSNRTIGPDELFSLFEEKGIKEKADKLYSLVETWYCSPRFKARLADMEIDAPVDDKSKTFVRCLCGEGATYAWNQPILC